MSGWLAKLSKRKWGFTVSGLALFGFLLIFGLLSWNKLSNYRIILEETAEIFTVNPGDPVSTISNNLAAEGKISHPYLMSIYARLRGFEKSIQEGEYLLETEITLAELVEKMVDGDKFQRRITFLEGWSLSQVLAELRSKSSITQEIDNSDPTHIAQLLGLNVSNAEGMFFPDTYFFTRNTSDIEILKRANAKLNEVLESLWRVKGDGLPFSDPYEALILASIIEKESGLNTERSEISGVFLRRLALGMRLQSDPTVIYGMGSKYKGNITKQDLAEVTTYNTYRINGLPPTPISLAGTSSISASLNPASSNFLYFVSRGDGSHYFSETLSEHNAAVNKYQRNPKSQ